MKISKNIIAPAIVGTLFAFYSYVYPAYSLLQTVALTATVCGSFTVFVMLLNHLVDRLTGVYHWRRAIKSNNFDTRERYIGIITTMIGGYDLLRDTKVTGQVIKGNIMLITFSTVYGSQEEVVKRKVRLTTASTPSMQFKSHTSVVALMAAYIKLKDKQNTFSTTVKYALEAE